MIQIALEKPGRFITTEGSSPRPAAGEALVRVHRIGVCGTDLHAFAGRQPFFNYPRILGHELGVEVIDPGSEPLGLNRRRSLLGRALPQLRTMHRVPRRPIELLRRAEVSRSARRRRHASGDRRARAQAPPLAQSFPTISSRWSRRWASAPMPSNALTSRGMISSSSSAPVPLD